MAPFTFLSFTMSSTNDQPDSCGSFSPENATQVVVRAGKTFVCSACGTLVEIPADLEGQWVMASASSPNNASDPSDAPNKVPDCVETALSRIPVSAPSTSTTSAPATASPKRRPPRPKRPAAPKPVCFVGQAIEGLQVPTGKELHYAMGWVSFHLKVLDRQGSEVKHLRKKRPKGRGPCPRPRGHTEELPAEKPQGSSPNANPSQIHEGGDGEPNRDDQHKRGPP